MLDRKRIGLLHVAKAQLKLQDDDYRAILLRVACVSSAKELSVASFDEVMREFEKLGFNTGRRKASVGYRAGMASPEQVALIEALWRDYLGEDDGQAFRSWLERFHHVSDARFLTNPKAIGVIGALRKMAQRPKVA